MSSISKTLISACLSVGISMPTLAAECPRDASNPKRLTAPALRTVVITSERNPSVFADERFSLSSTLESILTTAFVANPSSPIPIEEQKEFASSRSEQLALLTDLIRTFRQLDRVNNGVTDHATFRKHEAELDPARLLSEMKPVGLFNRFDLAPASWNYCGEHRVVYAMGTGINRMFLIFEAAIDNPDNANSQTGCRRIAEFWSRLQSVQESELADMLAGFYFRGELNDGGATVTPVLHNQHLGVPFGQVRGNLFLTEPEGPSVIPWMLREWRTFPSIRANATFLADTVKSNPHPELYNDDPIPLAAVSGRTQSFVDLRPEFQDKFIVSHVRELIDVDLEAAQQGRTPNSDDLFNQLSAAFDDKFNDFESVSQGESDVVRGSATLAAQIDRELLKYRLPANWKITSQHILARAEALSCGGCHNLSQGKPIASAATDADPAQPQNDIVWPDALVFTHINEQGVLSDALLDSFLPARCDNLQNFLRPDDSSVTATPPASSELHVPAQSKARLSLQAVQRADTNQVASDALLDLSTEVQAARDRDSTTAGAFRRFRRTH